MSDLQKYEAMAIQEPATLVPDAYLTRLRSIEQAARKVAEEIVDSADLDLAEAEALAELRTALGEGRKG